MRAFGHLFARLLVSLATIGCVLVPCAPASADPGAEGANSQPCVLVDTDFDIDDLMTIPMVVGNKHVAAFVTTEGFTFPDVAAAALTHLITQPNQRATPVIVGARTNLPYSEIVDTWGRWVLSYRSSLSRLNDFLPEEPAPAPSGGDYVHQAVDAVAGCASVDVLVIGAYSSFVKYIPAIRSKVNQVVMMGRPLKSDPTKRDAISFDCEYDLAACRTAFFEHLPGLKVVYVDVPRTTCDATPNKPGCEGTVYGPTRSMVEGLKAPGLPATLKQVLLHVPDTWALDTWEQSGVSPKSLLADESAAMYLLQPDTFVLFGGPGGHYETILSPDAFRKMWTEATDRATTYR